MSLKSNLEKNISKTVGLISSAVSQSGKKQTVRDCPPAAGISDLCRAAASEGMVLLKNDGGILPFSENSTVSVFGRVQYNTFFTGYGSGGDVNAHYKINIIDGLKNCGQLSLNTELDAIYRKWTKENPPDEGFWGHWPTSYEEMPVSDALAKRAAYVSDAALVIIGRAAGEDRENTLAKGSYYLTDNEEKMLYAVSRFFKKWAVVLNIGSIFDFSWIEKYSVPCVLICWQGGMETGNALADVLCGKTSPSGKLTDTVAVSYDRQPTARNFGGKDRNLYEEDIFVGYRYFETFDRNSVLFEFGYGLTYSDFSFSVKSFRRENNGVHISAVIKNSGKTAAKNTLQVYFSAKNTALDMPERVLCAYAKSKELLPGEEQTVNFSVPLYFLCAYDDGGVTGYRSAYVLQKGGYDFFVGLSIRDTVKAGSFLLEEDAVFEQLTEVCAPLREEHLMRLKKLDRDGAVARTYKAAPYKTTNLRRIITDNLPELILNTKPDCTFDDVRSDKATLEEFTASLSAKELEALSRGDCVMNSPLGAEGNASVYGGVLESLRKKGVPPLTCTDGPSGIRLFSTASLLPNGTALASAWNTELVEALYSLVAEEMKERGSDVLLAPGMNIHRDPLCGRNFEYYSEDPLITGKTAAAAVKGLQKGGVSACPKHFACNNQETNRTKNDSVLSERALREIYLRGFEICVKEAKPKNIMTSYNKINGVWGHYNYELVTSVLRREWGYEGCVMTDWWMRPSKSPEFPRLRNQAYRVRAGVDVLMPGGGRLFAGRKDKTLLETLGEADGITLNELQQTALRVLRFAITKNTEAQKEKETEK